MISILVSFLIAFLVIFIVVLQSVRSSLLTLQERSAAANSSAEEVAQRAEQKAGRACAVAGMARDDVSELRQIITPKVEQATCKKCNGSGRFEIVTPSPLVAEIHASLVKRFALRQK